MFPAISGDAAPQDVMMATLDHMDRVDLEIAEMFDRRARGVGTVAERLCLVEVLRVQPNPTRGALGKGDRRLGSRRHARIYVGRPVSSAMVRARRHEHELRGAPTLGRIGLGAQGPHTVVRSRPSSTSLIVFKITASSKSPTAGSPVRENAIAPQCGCVAAKLFAMRMAWSALRASLGSVATISPFSERMKASTTC